MSSALAAPAAGFWAVLSNVTHPDFGPDVTFRNYLLEVHETQASALAGAKARRAWLAAAEARDEAPEELDPVSGCGARFIASTQMGTVRSGDKVFELTTRKLQGDGLCFTLELAPCVFRTREEADALRARILGPLSTLASVLRIDERVYVAEHTCV